MPSVEDHFQVNNQDIPDDHNSNHNTILVSEYYPPLPAPTSLPPSLEIELRNKIADLEKAGLATATPAEQKQMLGERIFPLIQRIYPDPDRAAKITGMLLKNDNEDLLTMIEDPDYLSKEAKAAVNLF